MSVEYWPVDGSQAVSTAAAAAAAAIVLLAVLGLKEWSIPLLLLL